MNTEDHYLKSIVSYYLENLPEELLASFIPQEKITLSPAMMEAFAVRLAIPRTLREKDTGHELLSIANHVQELLNRVEQKAFIRLGSRSPKDSLCKILPCGTARDMFDMFFFSKRILDDVHWAYLYEYPVSIFVRPWLPIEKWQEFRCIIRKGQVAGVSQYYIEERPFYQEIYKAAHTIAKEIFSFLQSAVIPYAAHQDYVCDVLYSPSSICLIDYNPLLNSTGLCFFNPNFPPATSPEFRLWTGESIGVVPLIA